jgi:hypothetical protein
MVRADPHFIDFLMNRKFNGSAWKRVQKVGHLKSTAPKAQTLKSPKDRIDTDLVPI